jgi:nitrite reductase (NADH) large subunit
VVVLGNGIAGVTAADFLRRNHPESEIHVVGREPLPLYNRMAISRLIYGRSAMQGLYLLPDDWYEEQRITCWLNTFARRIDLDEHKVRLGTGEDLDFDRLILATGSSSFVPPIERFGLPGSFVLREASDAMSVRSFGQEHGVGTAVVAGGGLLGLEAAHALHQLGVAVTVLERGPRLLAKQVDERASQLLADYFQGLGIHVLFDAETLALVGEDTVTAARLKDGTLVACEMLLACVGIRPSVELARDAGLEVNRGVVVDDTMRTSAPEVYAAGDGAEHGGQVLGLWPAAVAQAEVAAVNAAGGHRVLSPVAPAVILKGVGMDLTAAGVTQPRDGDEVVVAPPDGHSYAKLVLTGGQVVGGIVLGRPADAPRLLAAVKKRLDVSDRLASLRAGDWSVLDDMPNLAPVN